MADAKQPLAAAKSATSIWDDRYKDEKLACTVKDVDGDPIDYTQHPFLWKHAVGKRLTGSLDEDPTKVFASQFLRPPAKQMLSIGSGIAMKEEWYVKYGYVEHVVAFEASKVATDSAQKRLSKEGLLSKFEFRNDNIIEAGLEPESFDVVFVHAAIHHFFNIEEMFALMHAVLKPDGLLMYDEYVGPDHHLYEPEVCALMDEINDCLAEPYRKDALRNGEIRKAVPRATLEWMMKMDPSEGVHASQILPLTYKYFDIERRCDYGGSIMRPFFCGILPNFDFEDPKDQTIARLIIWIEELLTRNGQIPHYHTVVVGRKREVPRRDLTEDEAKRINYSNWDNPYL